MPYCTIKSLSDHVGESVTLKGWLYNKRDSKGLSFVVLRDGTGLAQCVVAEETVSPDTWDAVSSLTQESSVVITGMVRADDRQVGGFEVQAESVDIIQIAEPYPITPKPHGIEFLMDNRHLWLRSRRPWAMMRIRNQIIMSIHQFFQERDFIQMDAPIFTGNAVEGTSTLFEVDYFDQKAYLTQSGQLYGEAMAMAHGRIYTFGPTFRAEKSKTRRHLTEFWMIEPEMAFCNLDDNMDMAEAFLAHIAADVVNHCAEELEVLERNVDALRKLTAPFPRMSYSEAVDLLKSEATSKMLDAEMEGLKTERDELQTEAAENRKRYPGVKKWEKKKIDAREIEINVRLEDIERDLQNLPDWKASAENFEWGNDFGGSDETVLTRHFDKPIIVHRYPAAVKAFYMKRDPEDDRLALGMDVLAPEGYGEVIGGGERATDLAFLEKQVADHGLPPEAFTWYFDLRRFGSVPHSGFGLGLERTVSWLCGLKHIRETIPFPRMMTRLHP